MASTDRLWAQSLAIVADINESLKLQEAGRRQIIAQCVAAVRFAQRSRERLQTALATQYQQAMPQEGQPRRVPRVARTDASEGKKEDEAILAILNRSRARQAKARIVQIRNDPLRVGIIGCGKLGLRLMQELLAKEVISADRLYVSTRRPEAISSWGSKGVHIGYNNRLVAFHCHLVFLCCLPHQLNGVSSSLFSAVEHASAAAQRPDDALIEQERAITPGPGPGLTSRPSVTIAPLPIPLPLPLSSAAAGDLLPPPPSSAAVNPSSSSSSSSAAPGMSPRMATLRRASIGDIAAAAAASAAALAVAPPSSSSSAAAAAALPPPPGSAGLPPRAGTAAAAAAAASGGPEWPLSGINPHAGLPPGLVIVSTLSAVGEDRVQNVMRAPLVARTVAVGPQRATAETLLPFAARFQAVMEASFKATTDFSPIDDQIASTLDSIKSVLESGVLGWEAVSFIFRPPPPPNAFGGGGQQQQQQQQRTGPMAAAES